MGHGPIKNRYLYPFSEVYFEAPGILKNGDPKLGPWHPQFAHHFPSPSHDACERKTTIAQNLHIVQYFHKSQGHWGSPTRRTSELHTQTLHGTGIYACCIYYLSTPIYIDPFSTTDRHIFSQTLHGTAIYAAPLTPHGPPQLIGIYGIHGVSGFVFGIEPPKHVPRPFPDHPCEQNIDQSLTAASANLPYTSITHFAYSYWNMEFYSL